jgi:hypothetical protein
VGGADPARGTGLLGLKERAEANRRHRLASQPSGCRHVARRGASPRRKITTPSAHPAASRERRAQQRLGTGLLRPSPTRLCEHHRRQHRRVGIRGCGLRHRTMTASGDAGKSLGREAVRVKRDQGVGA